MADGVWKVANLRSLGALVNFNQIPFFDYSFYEGLKNQNGRQAGPKWTGGSGNGLTLDFWVLLSTSAK